MTVNIENGQNIIDIKSDGFVTCLKVRKPIAVDWYDCSGSAGKYFSFTNDFESIAKCFNDVLTIGNDEEIIASISDFLKLFNSGQYSIFIDRNRSADSELHFEYSQSNSSNNFDYGYYNPSGENLMFTQLYSNINKDKVKEYEELILKGQRPKAVVFQAFFNDYGTYDDGSKWMRSVDSPMFILDGHHKLLAYKNLNINSEFVLITKERIGKEEFIKSKENLFFEFEYFLTERLKLHIISHNPKLLTDNSISTKNYNHYLDKYLVSTKSIETEILKIFKIASNSNELKELNWLLDRIEIIGKRDFEKNKMWLHFNESTEQYPNGVWNAIEINSPRDLHDWIKKMFDKTLDELKNNIT